jgi:hypothetical protein
MDNRPVKIDLRKKREFHSGELKRILSVSNELPNSDGAITMVSHCGYDDPLLTIPNIKDASYQGFQKLFQTHKQEYETEARRLTSVHEIAYENLIVASKGIRLPWNEMYIEHQAREDILTHRNVDTFFKCFNRGT